MNIKAIRESVREILQNIPEMQGVKCYLAFSGIENSTTNPGDSGPKDYEELVAEDLRSGGKGVAIVIGATAGGLSINSASAGRAIINVALPIAIIENPTTNQGAGGLGITSEECLEYIAGQVLGRDFGGGPVIPAADAFGRITDEEDGVTIHYLTFWVPWIMKRRW